jgi:hypothetical protein
MKLDDFIKTYGLQCINDNRPIGSLSWLRYQAGRIANKHKCDENEAAATLYLIILE